MTIKLLLSGLVALAVPALMAGAAQAQHKNAGKQAAVQPARSVLAKPSGQVKHSGQAKHRSKGHPARHAKPSSVTTRVIQVDSSSKQARSPKPSYKAGRDLLHDIQQRSNSVHRKLRNARTKHNTKRVRCLDAKLTQIHTLERVAGREVLALRGAMRIKSHDVAQWRMMRLRIMALRAAELSAETKSCGASIRRKSSPRGSGTRVRVLKRPSLPRYYDMPYWARDRNKPAARRVRTARQRRR